MSRNTNILKLFFLAFIVIVLSLIVVFQYLNVKQTTSSHAAVGGIMPPILLSTTPPGRGGNGTPAPTIYLMNIPNPDFEQWQSPSLNQQIPLYWRAPYAFRYSPPSPTFFSQSTDAQAGQNSLSMNLNSTSQLNLVSDVFHLEDGLYSVSIWSKLLSGTPTATIHLTKGLFFGGHIGGCPSNTDALTFTAESSATWTNTARIVQIKNESTTPTPTGKICATDQYFIFISVSGNNGALLLDNINLQKKL